ncbi:hypothetical protein DM860_004340 [Cuscuta australis]|uniref:Pentacotripeptide-repeat region of PRORP domain-containing protein n=1 Tax=Cuscuta australis TaxID=267555 RepID=A0A328EBD3_9ASTE|nr:hypothetical protein DM860_004340 [Cuscuta australis]
MERSVRCSSSSFLPSPVSCSTKFPREFRGQKGIIFLRILAAKSTPENTSQAVQKGSKKDLSRILRTEAAVKAIEKKANSSKYNNLWPKVVLEALHDAIRENRWESALKIFNLLRKQHWYQPKCRTYARLLAMLGNCRQPNQASLLFEMLRSDGLRPTVDVYTALASAYGLSGLIDEALDIIHDMNSTSDCKPDVFTYSILIKCCMKFQRHEMIDQMLAEMSYLGIRCSNVTYNNIIDGYGKANLFEKMENSLLEMIGSGESLPDIFTLNSVVGAYGNGGNIEKMEKWFDEFQLMGIKPDVMTFNILIKSYGRAMMYEKMGQVVDYMRKRFYMPTIVTYNIIIETFGKAGNIYKMEEFFLEMKHRGMKPNSITYCTLISAYSRVGVVEKVDSIMRQVENSDVLLDTAFFNCAINAYGHAGDMEKMVELFSEMKVKQCRPDNITFATMIKAFNAKGMFEAANDLQRKMLPDNNSAGTKLSRIIA